MHCIYTYVVCNLKLKKRTIMKKIITLAFFTLLFYNVSFSQETKTYAIVQVLTPKTVFGDFKINIFYGDENISEYKSIKYSKDNREKISTYVVDVLNYMKKEEYELINVVNFTIINIETQYIFRKRE